MILTKPRWMMLVQVGAVLWLGGCEPTVPNEVRSCATGCPPGTACEPATGGCVQVAAAPSATQPSACDAPRVKCGATCVDPMTDPNNCGGCGSICGPNASCVGGRCQCAGVSSAGSPWTNWNNSWYDGCECGGSCEGGGGCLDQSNACNPASPGSCGGSGSFCDSNNKCAACPAGYTNCDGTFQCECRGACNGQTCSTGGQHSRCEPGLANVCGGQSGYCDSNTRQCAPCPFGTINCDGVWNCECAGTFCSGPACQGGATGWGGGGCDPNQVNACGDTSRFCDALSRTCKSCPLGFKNCNGIDTCEKWPLTGACSPVSSPGSSSGGSCHDPNCLQCPYSLATCTQCRSPYVLMNGNCIKPRGSSYCGVPNCYRCLDSSRCAECMPGSYLDAYGRCS